MPLLTYEEIADDADATANLWNVRYGRIHDLLNGRLDQANLANGAVTTAKIANGAITSSKLGFEQYTDDNGWLITDLGLIKIATKDKPFDIPIINVGADTFIDFGDDGNNIPVGFDTSGLYSVQNTVYIASMADAYAVNYQASTPRINTSVRIRNVVSSNRPANTGTLSQLVIFNG